MFYTWNYLTHDRWNKSIDEPFSDMHRGLPELQVTYNLSLFIGQWINSGISLMSSYTRGIHFIYTIGIVSVPVSTYFQVRNVFLISQWREKLNFLLLTNSCKQWRAMNGTYWLLFADTGQKLCNYWGFEMGRQRTC